MVGSGRTRIPAASPGGCTGAAGRGRSRVGSTTSGRGATAPAGLGARERDVRLEIRGRRSGKVVGFPVVLADHDGAWHVVSMLGDDTNWVRNLRAAGGEAVIRHGREWRVRLVEVPVAERAPVLKRYVHVAPGGRPHIPVDRRRPVADFEAVAARYPVFRVEGLTLDDLRKPGR